MRKTFLALAALASLPAVALPGVAQATTSTPTYYVSVGDSYSVGYQPGFGSTKGYTVYVAAKTHLTLKNFGCGGATTTSILHGIGCPDVLPHTAGGVTYPTTTQIAAADAFISAHKGHIGLITVTIGGNDVTGCATQSNPILCVAGAAKNIKTNVTTLAADLRHAAGSGVPIIGSTYPDVILGAYVHPTIPPSVQSVSLAKLSVTAFKSLINPTLAKAYASVKGTFVDVTKATGAYRPLTKTVKTKTYGTIPKPVERVCKVSWYCIKGDIHATTKGYDIIGKLIVAQYHKDVKKK